MTITFGTSEWMSARGLKCTITIAVGSKRRIKRGHKIKILKRNLSKLTLQRVLWDIAHRSQTVCSPYQIHDRTWRPCLFQERLEDAQGYNKYIHGTCQFARQRFADESYKNNTYKKTRMNKQPRYRTLGRVSKSFDPLVNYRCIARNFRQPKWTSPQSNANRRFVFHVVVGL